MMSSILTSCSVWMDLKRYNVRTCTYSRCQKNTYIFIHIYMCMYSRYKKALFPSHSDSNSFFFPLFLVFRRSVLFCPIPSISASLILDMLGIDGIACIYEV